MMFFIVLVAVFSTVLSNPVSYKYEDFKQYYEYLGDGQPPVDIVGDHIPEASDFIYYFYNLKDTSYPAPAERQLRYTDIGKVKNYFSADRETIVIFPGYWTNSSKPDNNDIVLSMINGKHNYNIIVADYTLIWSRVTSDTFFSSAGKIGGFAADFLMSLVKTYKLNIKKTMLVGFSAGGLLAGATGKSLKTRADGGKVRAIFGLDTGGIASGDADFVEYVHTTSGSGGAKSGDADFYPNGGSNQAGCPDNKGCSHGRSFMYFSESVNDNKFVGRRCDTYENFQAGKCDSNPTAIMGMLTPDTKAAGKYFLLTNSKAPFSKGTPKL